jgi:competence protein ComGC
MEKDVQANQKRSFTVPILLVIIVILSILCVLYYSKQLLAEQNEKTDTGMRLAEKYVHTQAYAELLHKGAEQLLNATSEVDRLQAKEKLGEARFASTEAMSLITDAIGMQTGQTNEQAKASIAGIEAVLGGENSLLHTVGEHDGPLTEAEKAILSEVSAESAKAEAALKDFLAPSGVAGYRIMAEGGEWIAAVLETKLSFDALAQSLSEPNLNP